MRFSYPLSLPRWDRQVLAGGCGQASVELNRYVSSDSTLTSVGLMPSDVARLAWLPRLGPPAPFMRSSWTFRVEIDGPAESLPFPVCDARETSETAEPAFHGWLVSFFRGPVGLSWAADGLSGAVVAVAGWVDGEGGGRGETRTSEGRRRG